ncbi:mannose-6-phosphate isomerase-like protein (cupin superfamily) [Natronobacillus azotifigens]|uniref:Cupin n=1 Tax=Natronobacillus azotifigens TaxID=472978 RepID=A0A9J6RBU9_9BACI|nr:cupin [Natronobacillus azotifigens]MCZ0703023.1 cupin [Natronobacillus azotifigens]
MSSVQIFENTREGISCVYKNKEWLVSIKNWKPDNDISGVKHLEVHHETDEQFILVNGKAILISADLKDLRFENIELTEMKIGKVYNVPKEKWFYSITQKNTKMIYIQHAETSLTNSEFYDLTSLQISEIQEEAKRIFNK